MALHVVVFPPHRDGPPVKTLSGREPESLTLLPHLPDDLETVADEDALLRAEGRPESVPPYAGLAWQSSSERRQRLEAAAHARWRSKVAFACARVARDGSAGAAHRLVLETLGLRPNRAPMAELAARFGPEDFAKADATSLFADLRGRWKLAGVRPANHPLARLESYVMLCRRRPHWQTDLLLTLAAAPRVPPTDDTAAFRRETRLGELRRHILREVLAGAIGGTRADTLMIDAILPWAAACDARHLYPHWFHWPLGDAPERTAAILRRMDLAGPGRPVCNGLFQGLLGLVARP